MAGVPARPRSRTGSARDKASSVRNFAKARPTPDHPFSPTATAPGLSARTPEAPVSFTVFAATPQPAVVSAETLSWTPTTWTVAGVEAPTRVSTSDRVVADAVPAANRPTRTATAVARKKRHHPAFGGRLTWVMGSVSRLYAVPGLVDTGPATRLAPSRPRRPHRRRCRTDQPLRNGRITPSADVIIRLAIALSVTSDSLVFANGAPGSFSGSTIPRSPQGDPVTSRVSARSQYYPRPAVVRGKGFVPSPHPASKRATPGDPPLSRESQSSQGGSLLLQHPPAIGRSTLYPRYRSFRQPVQLLVEGSKSSRWGEPIRDLRHLPRSSHMAIMSCVMKFLPSVNTG